MKIYDEIYLKQYIFNKAQTIYNELRLINYL